MNEKIPLLIYGCTVHNSTALLLLSIYIPIQASTWFKVPLEITRSVLGADQLRGVIKYHKGTITVEFDLRPLLLD